MMGSRFSPLRPGVVALMLAIAALAVGCGGDDEPTTTVDNGPTGPTGPTGFSSKDEFIERADAICAESNAAIANLSSGSVPEGVQADQELDITEGQVNSLDSLGTPPEDERTYDEFLSAMEEVVSGLERQQLAAERGEDTSAVSAEVEAARAQASEAAEEFGFEECGQEGEALDGGGEEGEDGVAELPAPAPAPAPAPEPTPAPAPAPPSGGTGQPAPDDGGGGGASGGVSP